MSTMTTGTENVIYGGREFDTNKAAGDTLSMGHYDVEHDNHPAEDSEEPGPTIPPSRTLTTGAQQSIPRPLATLTSG